ncbi:hypothetical protein ILUMI_07804 [Ignelater luminosus]|uniref:Uncharacterized protein n=1 Tax=Ignelater luminosus TaxID=2038154 RepID=A0A8K0D7J5_IGNLU|nr:hypothetical protein ILUMI_07804 [Ignelater luminosus]
MIASFDSNMREHIHKIKSSKPDSSRMTHYLGDHIENEIIDLLGMTIKKRIEKLHHHIRLHTGQEIEAESEVFKVQQETLFTIHQEVTDLLLQESKVTEYEAEKKNENNYKREIARIELMAKKVLMKNNLNEEIKSMSAFGGGSRNYRMRLTKRELPKYSGDVRRLQAFWAAFQEIDEDKDIPIAEKYQYLVQSTVPESEAWKVVISYPISGKNYDKAVEDLKERFGREKMLIKVYVRDLLKLVIKNAKVLCGYPEFLEVHGRFINYVGFLRQLM